MKSIIYNRTSTDEQNPKNQLADCLSLASKLGLECEIIEEMESAFRDKHRREFQRIWEMIAGSKVNNIIVWDLDRLYRNRKKLISFFDLCKLKGCKVYSFRQSWLEDLNKIPAPFNEIMNQLMIQIMGWLAEEESEKKSERVKNSVRRIDGITKSYKGNKWGRKAINNRVRGLVIEGYKANKTIRQIAKEVIYYDKNNNPKNLSIGAVHKIILDFKAEESGVQSTLPTSSAMD